MILLVGLLFYLLRVHVHTLGDGYQRVYQVEKGYLHNPPEPLDFFLHSILYMGLNPLFGIEAETIYTSLSIIFGILFVIGIYLFKFPESINKSSGSLVKMLILSLGGIQIFFGYVESYSLLYPATLLFILYAYRYLLIKSGLIITTILFVLAISSHQLGYILLPAFCYLLYFNLRIVKPSNKSEKILPIIISLIVLMTLIGFYINQSLKFPQYQTSISDMLLPFYSASEYSIISFAHIIDIFNEILLIAPMIIILVPLFIKYKTTEISKKQIKYFFYLMIGPSILFICLFDPKLGMARDWDLFSTPMAIVGLVVILLSLERKHFNTMSKYAKTSLIFGTLFFVAVWIFMNSSESRQLIRAEKLLEVSSKNRSYSLELIAHHYWQILDDKEKALEFYYRIDEENRSARICQKITQLEYKLKHYRKAIKSAYLGISKDDKMIDLYVLCGASYQKLKIYPKALEYLLKARKLKPKHSYTYSYLGNTYLKMDSLGKALESHKMSAQLDPNSATNFFNTAYIFIEMKVFDSAQLYVNAGLKIDPK
ncbi:MAG: hypothetical protein GY865_08850, partial [candidate division Zixibacteria bacterium]|nr:hypothetical protein [candidate division Zixibacteria bacterium]